MQFVSHTENKRRVTEQRIMQACHTSGAIIHDMQVQQVRLCITNDASCRMATKVNRFLRCDLQTDKHTYRERCM